jgi:CheY-like chemotaxis protein
VARRRQIERELLRREETIQESVRARDVALSTLSHELRSPLAALVSAAALLREPGLPPDDAEDARDVMDRQLERLAALADSLGEALRRGEPLAPRPEPPPEAVPPRPPAPAGRPLRLLVIEDNVDTATALAAFLTRSGHETMVAFDGARGLRIALDGGFDAVLCDLGLPEMTGFEVARALRAEPRTAATPLLAISGFGEPEDRRRSEEAGFDRHLIKPVDPRDLLGLLAGMSPAAQGAQGSGSPAANGGAIHSNPGEPD